MAGGPTAAAGRARWSLPARVAVCAGTSATVDVTVRLRAPPRGDVELRLPESHAAALTAGIRAWAPSSVATRRAQRGLYWRCVLALSILVCPGLAAEPARHDVPLALVERESGARIGDERSLSVDVLPGYTRVHEQFGSLRLRNETAITWTQSSEHIVDPWQPQRRVAMQEPRVGPREVATFVVPPDMWQTPVRLVSDRVATYSPALVVAAGRPR